MIAFAHPGRLLPSWIQAWAVNSDPELEMKAIDERKRSDVRCRKESGLAVLGKMYELANKLAFGDFTL